MLRSLALTDTEADCRFLNEKIKNINKRIKDLQSKIQSNLEILGRGVGNRVRVRIEDNIFNQMPSRDEAETQARANNLRQEIRDWQTEISQLEAERAEIRAVQRSLGC